MQKIMLSAAVLASTLGLTACESTNARKVESDKDVQYLDLRGTDYNSADYWVMEGGGTLTSSQSFPEHLVKERKNGCTKILIGINSEGRLAGYKPLMSFPDPSIARYAAAHMDEVQWIPTESNSERQPILTEISFTFQIEGFPKSVTYEEYCGDIKTPPMS